MFMPQDPDEQPDEGVTFLVPTAAAGADAYAPGEETAPDVVAAAPVYVVVMHEGHEVLYKKVEG